MMLERRNFLIEGMEFRQEEGAAAELRGYASVFGRLSLPMYGFKERVEKGAFANSLKKNNVRALWNHNPDYPLGSMKGQTLELEEDKKGLRFRILLPENSWGKDAAVAVERKDVEGVSIGFRTIKDQWEHGKSEGSSIRTLLEVDLIEVSPTPFPAYPSTSVATRSFLGEQGVEYDLLAGALLRSKSGALLDDDYQLIKDTIATLQEIYNARTVPYSIDTLRRRLNFAEKQYI